MANLTLRDKLCEPFGPQDLEWRVVESGKTKDDAWWCKLVPYITARAIQNRLDDAVGPENWSVRYVAQGDGDAAGLLCGISVHLADGREVTKWDGSGLVRAAQPDASDDGGSRRGGLSSADAVKGSISGAFKRAAVAWGVGRYLYNITDTWGKPVQLDERKRPPGGAIRVRLKAKPADRGGKIEREWVWVLPPQLPDHCLPTHLRTPPPRAERGRATAEPAAAASSNTSNGAAAAAAPPPAPARPKLAPPGPSPRDARLPKLAALPALEGLRLAEVDTADLETAKAVFARHQIAEWVAAVDVVLKQRLEPITKGGTPPSNEDDLPF